VRELVHTLERAIAVARYEPTLFPKHLPTHIRVGMACRALTGGRGRQDGTPALHGDNGKRSASPGRLKDIRESALSVIERQYLVDLMDYTGWDIREACRISDLSRPRLYALMGKYRMSRPAEGPSVRSDIAGPRRAPVKGHASGPR
jgi:two-component system NtrC family response regulator